MLRLDTRREEMGWAGRMYGARRARDRAGGSTASVHQQCVVDLDTQASSAQRISCLPVRSDKPVVIDRTYCSLGLGTASCDVDCLNSPI